MELALYKDAKRALAKLVSIDEVLEVKDKAKAMQVYAQQVKDKELMAHATEYNYRAQRRLGELLREMAERKERAKPGDADGNKRRPSVPKLSDLGVTKIESSRCQKLAKLAEKEFDVKLARTVKDAVTIVTGPKKDIHHATTGEIEWFTPPEYLEATVQVMGKIDLDPASSKVAQKRVKAAAYYTIENDGLFQRWTGKVFLNPPYRMPDIRQFSEKMLASLGDIDEAIMLTNAQCGTEWFHKLARASSALCLFLGRIAFVQYRNGEYSILENNTHSQVFFYFGAKADKFAAVFKKFGLVYGQALNQEAASS